MCKRRRDPGRIETAKHRLSDTQWKAIISESARVNPCMSTECFQTKWPKVTWQVVQNENWDWMKRVRGHLKTADERDWRSARQKCRHGAEEHRHLDRVTTVEIICISSTEKTQGICTSTADCAGKCERRPLVAEAGGKPHIRFTGPIDPIHDHGLTVSVQHVVKTAAHAAVKVWAVWHHVTTTYWMILQTGRAALASMLIFFSSFFTFPIVQFTSFFLTDMP